MSKEINYVMILRTSLTDEIKESDVQNHVLALPDRT